MLIGLFSQLYEYQSIKVMIQYSTNLTDKRWQVIEKIINTQERKRKHSLRNIMNAILYLLKTGCLWRMIPKDFAPWQSVYYYFSKWKNEGIIEELLDKLRSKVRVMAGRKENPSRGIIDSRSVKTSHHVDSDRATWTPILSQLVNGQSYQTSGFSTTSLRNTQASLLKGLRRHTRRLHSSGRNRLSTPTYYYSAVFIEQVVSSRVFII